MKKLTRLLIGCSLALAGAALAEQPVEQPTPKNAGHGKNAYSPSDAWGERGEA